MKRLFLTLAFVSLPAAAQDAERGKLVYETQCGGCHYERVHQRDRSRSSVATLADLRDEVVLRAGQTGRPFTLEDLEDVAEYLNRSYYRFGLEPAGARELIYGAELMSAEEREQYRREIAADGAGGQARVREQYRQRIRARAKARGVELAEPHGIVRR
jgi:hypothetical protein